MGIGRRSACGKNKYVLLSFSLISTLCFGGAVIGWPALRAILEDQGFLADKCDFSGLCFSRQFAFHSIFFAASIASMVARPLYNALNAQLGAGWAGGVSLFSVCVGSILCSQAHNAAHEHAAYVFGMLFVGLGSSSTIDAVAQLFGRHKERFQMAGTVATHVGSLVFLVFLGLYTVDNINADRSFLVYLFFAGLFAWLNAVFIPANILSLLPKKKLQQTTKRVLAAVRLQSRWPGGAGGMGSSLKASNSILGALGAAKSPGSPRGLSIVATGSGAAPLSPTGSATSNGTDLLTQTQSTSVIREHTSSNADRLSSARFEAPGAPEKVITAASQMKSAEFVLFVVFFALESLSSEFFLGTLNDQILVRYLRVFASSDPVHVFNYPKWFVLMFGLLALIIPPFVMWIVTKTHRSVLFVITLLSFIIQHAILLFDTKYHSDVSHCFVFFFFAMGKISLNASLTLYLRHFFGALHYIKLSSAVYLITTCVVSLNFLFGWLALHNFDTTQSDRHQRNFNFFNGAFVIQELILLAFYPFFVFRSMSRKHKIHTEQEKMRANASFQQVSGTATNASAMPALAVRP